MAHPQAQSQQQHLNHAPPSSNSTHQPQPQQQNQNQQHQSHQLPHTNQKAGKSNQHKAAASPVSKNDAIDQWVCVLCRKICHYRGLGDLYGPYNIDFSSQADKTVSNTEKCKSITPKKSKYSLLNHNYAVKEIWIHEDCLVWSEGVHLVGKKIFKMDETIKASFNYNCSICKTKGATIGCAGKRCRRKFHYICGRDTNCLLDEANFTLKCDKCLANTAASLSLSINR